MSDLLFGILAVLGIAFVVSVLFAFIWLNVAGQREEEARHRDGTVTEEEALAIHRHALAWEDGRHRALSEECACSRWALDGPCPWHTPPVSIADRLSRMAAGYFG